MVLTVFFSSRISPFTSTVIFRLRSPLAMAVATSAMLRTCEVRLPAMKFTLSVRSFQVPATPFTSACPPSLPSVPTSRDTRVTSEANELSWSTIVLMVFFNARISPHTARDLPGSVPRGNGRRYLGDVAHLRRQIAGHEIDVIREIFPGPRHAFHLRLATQFSFRTYFTGHAGDFRSERIELVYHRVD